MRTNKTRLKKASRPIRRRLGLTRSSQMRPPSFDRAAGSQSWGDRIEFPPGHNFPSETARHPIADYALPLLRQAESRFSLGRVMGLRGFAALIPLGLVLVTTVWLVPLFERRWIRTATGWLRYGPHQQIPPEAL